MNSLPPELFTAILYDVYKPQDGEWYKRGSLVTCMLVSQQWKSYAQRVLYRDLVLQDAQVDRFIDASDKEAFIKLTRSLTIRYGGSTIQYKQWIGFDALITRLTLSVFPLVHSQLRSFSLYAPEFTSSQAVVAAMLNSLPASCVDLELCITEVRDGHIYDDVRKLLPRMRRVRLSLEGYCGALFGRYIADHGFQATVLPSDLIVIIDGLRTTNLRKTGNMANCHTQNKNPRLYMSKKDSIWYSITWALQRAVQQGALQAQVILTDALCYPVLRRIHNQIYLLPHYIKPLTTCLRFEFNQDGASTWAFLLEEGLYHFRHRDQEMLFPGFMRTNKGSFVFESRTARNELAEGFQWRTSATTGARLADDVCRDPAVSAISYRNDGIWTQAEWRTDHPLQEPILWSNERLAGMSLFEPEKINNANRREAKEATPLGFYRNKKDPKILCKITEESTTAV